MFSFSHVALLLLILREETQNALFDTISEY